VSCGNYRASQMTRWDFGKICERVIGLCEFIDKFAAKRNDAPAIHPGTSKIRFVPENW
jgi:hypothetical protein